MPSTRKPGKRRQAGRIAAVALVVETAGVWLRTRRLGGKLIVRCRAGHLFTTIWIPAASVKSLRLGLWRVQRCPVGRHWSLVTPVNERDLSEDERRFAREHQDIPLP
jgi:hypothetical protein